MKEVEKHIDELIVRCLLDETGADDKNILNNWLNASVENQEYYSKLEKVWNKSEGVNAFDQVDVEADFDLFKTKVGMDAKPSAGRVIRFNFMRVAAVMLPIVLFLSVYGLYETTPGFGKWEACNSHDHIENMTLSDETEVTLNANSQLVFEKGFNDEERVVKLNGEGFFQVAKNPDKPFIVYVGDAKVRVLGTAFNINENKSTGQITLSVTEGKVRFSLGNESLELIKGEAAVGINGQLIKKDKASLNCLSWRTGVLNFEDATLTEVSDALVNHFDQISVVENNSKQTDRRITTKFTNPSVNEVLDELRLLFEKKFEINDHKLIISD
jgi:ferric-dicitrate binding protein FerR (iron transport regulator)